MAIIGFLVLVALGLICLFAAFAGALVARGFSGSVEWPHFILFGGAGAALLYVAYTHAPFTILIG